MKRGSARLNFDHWIPLTKLLAESSLTVLRGACESNERSVEHPRKRGQTGKLNRATGLPDRAIHGPAMNRKDNQAE